MASSFEEACQVADRIGFPLLVRPSYVLGGRGMVIAYDAQYLEKYMAEAARITPDHPVYLDRFLEGAIESDVDALCDGEDVYIGGVLEHIEEAGVHSGDSACCIPPFTLSEAQVSQLRNITRRLAKRLGVVGLINIQFADQGRCCLCYRGQSSVHPVPCLCLEGYGCAFGKARCSNYGWREDCFIRPS